MTSSRDDGKEGGGVPSRTATGRKWSKARLLTKERAERHAKDLVVLLFDLRDLTPTQAQMDAIVTHSMKCAAWVLFGVTASRPATKRREIREAKPRGKGRTK